MSCFIVVYKHGHAYVIQSTEGHAQKWMGDEFKGCKHRSGVVAMSRCVAKQRTVMVTSHMQLRRPVHVGYTPDIDQSKVIHSKVRRVSAFALTSKK